MTICSHCALKLGGRQTRRVGYWSGTCCVCGKSRMVCLALEDWKGITEEAIQAAAGGKERGVG